MDWYRFYGWNLQERFGCGSEAEAEKYCQHLNKDRETNLYGYEVVEDQELIARLEGSREWPNLEDELNAIREEQSI